MPSTSTPRITAVEDRRVVEHPQQVLVQHAAEPRHHRQEQQHADEVGQRAAHAISRLGGAVTGRGQDVDAFAGAGAAAAAKAPTSMRAFTPWSIR